MDLVDAAMIASGFLGAGAIVGGWLAKLGGKMERVARGLAAFRHEWEGEPARDGEPAVPGVMARMTATESHLGQQDIHLARQDDHLAAQDKALEQIRTALTAMQQATKPGGP